MSLVLDASTAVDLVVGRPELTMVLFGEDLHVPATFDVEAASTIRGLVLHRALPEEAAARALGDLAALAVIRYPPHLLLNRAWALRHDLSIYDGVYVALAEELRSPLVTTDARLARTRRPATSTYERPVST